MQMPAFDLPTGDGGRLTDADLAGRPWYVYLSRHTGCYICQYHLSRALEKRAEVQALGGDLLVFFPARVDHVRGWLPGSQIPEDLTVVVDPEVTVYEALGTVHGSGFGHWKKIVRDMWQAKGSIGSWRITSDDMSRMGADLAVAPDGELVFSHICADADDRAEPAAVVDALRVAVPA